MAGRLNLAVTGIQDRWLTEEPQFSYFLSSYNRHSRFALEQIESPFDGTLDFDNIIECRIPQNKGDLIRNFTLKINLTDPTPDASGNSHQYVPSVCTRLVEYADLLIGGQTIERITGEYIYMHQQLNNTDDDVAQSLYFLNGHGNLLGYTTDYTYFLDLPFYFYRHPSLSIPICALTKQQVEVRIKLRPLNKIVRDTHTDSVPANPVAKIKRISLDTEFVFVSEIERDYFKSRPLDYCITQVQLSKFHMDGAQKTKSVMLNFKNPVKELLYFSRLEEYDDTNKHLAMEVIENIELRFNNNPVINADEKFSTYEQPLLHYVNSPTVLGVTNVHITPHFGVYSFSDDPGAFYPTGQVNMSRISHKLLTVTLAREGGAEARRWVQIYAVNYNILRIDGGLAGLKF